jgi:DHA2 family multidrug resistance protein-like MFS transporter
VLGSIGIAVYRSQLAAAMPEGISAPQAQAALETLGAAAVVAGQVPGPLGATLLSNAQQAFVQGLHLNAIIGTVVMVSLVFLTAILLRNLQTHSESETEPQGESNELVTDRAGSAHVPTPAR